MRSQRMKKIEKIADIHAQKAALIMAQRQEELSQAFQGLYQLQHFRDDYYQKILLKGAEGFQALEFRELENFVRRLDHAIKQQQGNIQQLQQRFEQAQQVWQKKYQRVAILSQVTENFEAQEAKEADHQAQRWLDEWVVMQYSRKDRN